MPVMVDRYVFVVLGATFRLLRNMISLSQLRLTQTCSDGLLLYFFLVVGNYRKALLLVATMQAGPFSQIISRRFG